MNDSSANDGTFEDPLENYDPKNYDDSLEEAMAEESVSHVQHQPHASIHPELSVADASTVTPLEPITVMSPPWVDPLPLSIGPRKFTRPSLSGVAV